MSVPASGGTVRLPRSELPPIHMTHTYEEGLAPIEACIQQKAAAAQAGGTGPLHILEAGCGNSWPLKLDPSLYKLTATDIDSNALAIRSKRLREDVDNVVAGDLRTPDLFPDSSFDVIYNSYVLEHVDGAAGVLDNFLRWLTPGGLLILRIPDRDSAYGFVTRYSPFWAHVLFKKYIQHVKNAGKPGFDPYPTYYDPVVSRRGIRNYCIRHECRIRHEAGYASYGGAKKPFTGAMIRVAVRLVAALSAGRLEWRYNNLTFIIEK